MARIKVDMTNVQDGFVTVPEGDYICKVSKITLETSEKGSKYLKWEFVIGIGEYKGQKIWHNTSLLPQALFNLRNTIQALGIDVPKTVQSIDTDKYIGKIVGITVVHEEYQGKPKAKVADLWRAAKSAKGWGRATVAKAEKVLDKPDPEEEEEDVVDVSSVAVDEDEIEEIEV